MDEARQSLVLAQLDRVLQAYALTHRPGETELYEALEDYEMTYVGLQSIAQRIRDVKATLDKNVASLQAEVSEAHTQAQDAITQAQEVTKAIKAETAELRGALGQLSNGGPPLADYPERSKG